MNENGNQKLSNPPGASVIRCHKSNFLSVSERMERQNMKQIKLNRSLVSFITGGLLLAASPVSHADTILNIEQTTWGNGAVIYARAIP